MFGGLRHVRVNIVVAAIYALAMVTLGFAHKPIALPRADAVELGAFAALDGSAAPICLHSDSGQPAAPTLHYGGCDACALTASPGLPPVAQACLIAPQARSQRQPAPRVALVTPAPLRAPTSRGPPSA